MKEYFCRECGNPFALPPHAPPTCPACDGVGLPINKTQANPGALKIINSELSEIQAASTQHNRRRNHAANRSKEMGPFEIVNLTPHQITLSAPDGTLHALDSQGVARVASVPGALEDLDGVPVPVARPTTFGEITGLPDPKPGVVYVVSMMVAQVAKRPDVLSPGTGPADEPIRNAAGQIKAVTRLVAWV